MRYREFRQIFLSLRTSTCIDIRSGFGNESLVIESLVILSAGLPGSAASPHGRIDHFKSFTRMTILAGVDRAPCQQPEHDAYID